MKDNSKKILVTGGAGYVGSVLIRGLLQSGYFVRVIDNLIYGGTSLLGIFGGNNFEFFYGDIASKNDLEVALRGIDSVIHLAAIVGDPACSRQPELARRVNLEATRNLVNKAKEQGIKEFIFTSTCSNYGVTDSKVYADEESALNPISLYAETKVEAEKYILENASSAFSPAVLRLATVYGVSPRMRFDLLVNDFTKEAFARKKIVVYGEQFWRPYVHVKDVAEAVIAVLKAGIAKKNGEVFNIGKTSENYQKISIANMVKAKISNTVLEFVKKEEDPRNYKVSFEKIKNQTNFASDKIVKDGISETISLLENKIITDYDSSKYVN